MLVVGFFQLVVIRQPLPEDVTLLDLGLGLLSVVVGLTLFVRGLQVGLFPVGENLAHSFAGKGSAFWLLFFSFALGFGTTVAEPALIALACLFPIITVMAYGQIAEWRARRSRARSQSNTE